MKKLSAVLCAVLFAIAVNAQEIAPPPLSVVPPKAEAVKSIIAQFGDSAQIEAGYAAIADPADNWKVQLSPVVGVQGNLYNWTIPIRALTIQTTIRPGIVYLYATAVDRHLIGLGVTGSLTKLPPALQATKDGTGIVSKLPGNLDSINWFLSAGSVADRFQPFISGGLSLKW
jgi:hypothetical protein